MRLNTSILYHLYTFNINGTIFYRKYICDIHWVGREIIFVRPHFGFKIERNDAINFR